MWIFGGNGVVEIEPVFQFAHVIGQPIGAFVLNMASLQILNRASANYLDGPNDNAQVLLQITFFDFLVDVSLKEIGLFADWHEGERHWRFDLICEFFSLLLKLECDVVASSSPIITSFSHLNLPVKQLRVCSLDTDRFSLPLGRYSSVFQQVASRRRAQFLEV